MDISYNENQPSVSVIVPIYNAEKYISRAIESVLNQTFTKFELILIDDGSSDNSLSVCKNYEQRDSRVRVISKENGGISEARNLGINEAKGKYVCFLDDDDVYARELIEDNFNLAEKYDATIVKYGYKFVNEKNIFTNKKTKSSIELINKKIKGKTYMDLFRRKQLIYVWDSLINRNFLIENNIYFDNKFKYGHEDVALCVQIVSSDNIKGIVINPSIYYNHLVYKASTSNRFHIEQLALTELLLQYEKNAFVKMKIDSKYWDEWLQRSFQYVCRYLSFASFKELNFKETKDVLEQYIFKYPVKYTYQYVDKTPKGIMKCLLAYLYKKQLVQIITCCICFMRLIKK